MLSLNLKSCRLWLAIIALGILSGCSSKVINPLPMDTAFWQNNESKIGIAMTKVPAPEMVYPGADCLLCLGAAAAMNSSLSSHSEGLDTNDLKNIKQEIFNDLQSKGKNVVLLEQPVVLSKLKDNDSETPNSSLYDYSPLKNTSDISHLLLVDLKYAGIRRNYASYIPTSDPFVSITGRAFLVDLNNNIFNWYLPINVTKFTEGEWDEPDQDFPGITNSYYHAIETVKGQIKNPLK